MDCSLPGSSVRGFSGQEYWSGLLRPPPGDLPGSGIELRDQTQVSYIAGGFFTL